MTEATAEKPATDLSGVDTLTLTNELERRRVISSVWTIEDVRSAIEDDEAVQDLDNEQFEAVINEMFDDMSSGLQDILGERGNAYISEIWDFRGESILARVKGATPGV